MSLSIARRRDACLHYINSEFDIDKTVSWFLREYRNEPAVMKARDDDARRRLARNTVQIGGQGDQREMNAVAFSQALNKHVDAILDERAVADRDKRIELEQRNRSLDTRVSELETRIDTLRSENDRLKEQSFEHERERLKLAATA